MGTLGGIYSLGAIFFLYKDDGSINLSVFISVVILMLLSVVFLFITINENKLSQKAREEEKALTDSGQEAVNDSSKVTEKMPADVRRSFILILASIFLWFFAYNAVKTAFSRYADKVWGYGGGTFTQPLMVALGAALVAYILSALSQVRLVEKRQSLGIVIITLSYHVAFYLRKLRP